MRTKTVVFEPRTKASYTIYAKKHLVPTGTTRTLCGHWDVKADEDRIRSKPTSSKSVCFKCKHAKAIS